MTDLIPIPESDNDLLKECVVETFRASGKGGQHVNKTESAVRLTHHTSGIVVSCQNERSQFRNKQKCISELRKRLEVMNYSPPKRIPTKKPRAAKEKILKDKKHQSNKKQMRKPPNMEI